MLLNGMTFKKSIIKENADQLQKILKFIHEIVASLLENNETENLKIATLINLLESLSCNIHPVDLKHKFSHKIL